MIKPQIICRHNVEGLYSFTGINISSVLSQEEEDEEEADLSPVANPTPPPAISLMSPKATQVAGFIRICEEKHRAKAKVCTSLTHTSAKDRCPQHVSL